jgi:hypothetical protein
MPCTAAATLEGRVEASGAVFEAKFMLPWNFSEEGAAEKHMAQLQHNMWVTASRMEVLSIITGGGKWVEMTIPADPLYQNLLSSRTYDSRRTSAMRQQRPIWEGPAPYSAAYARQAISRQSAGSLGRLAVTAGSLLFWFGLARFSQPYARPSSVLMDELDAGRLQSAAKRRLVRGSNWNLPVHDLDPTNSSHAHFGGVGQIESAPPE